MIIEEQLKTNAREGDLCERRRSGRLCFGISLFIPRIVVQSRNTRSFYPRMIVLYGKGLFTGPKSIWHNRVPHENCSFMRKIMFGPRRVFVVWDVGVDIEGKFV